MLGCVAGGVDNRFNISGHGFLFCRMDLQLCGYLYVRHSLGSAERLRKEGLSAEIYKVSMPPFYCNIIIMIIKQTLAAYYMPNCSISEMEASLGGAERKHFAFKVFLDLLQKGDRLAVQ